MRRIGALVAVLMLAVPALRGTGLPTFELSIWNRTLERWDTTVTLPPGTPPRTCTPHATGRGLEVRCR